LIWKIARHFNVVLENKLKEAIKVVRYVMKGIIQNRSSPDFRGDRDLLSHLIVQNDVKD